MSLSTISFGSAVLAACVMLAAQAQAKTAPENTAAACQDGADNDEDGYLDCADQDCGLFVFCAAPPAPLPPAPEPAPAAAAEPPPILPPSAAYPGGPAENTDALCSDRQDNDADGSIDCGDGDCLGLYACSPQAAAPAAGTPPAKKARGGGGILGYLVVFNRGKLEWNFPEVTVTGSESWIMRPVTGGLGLFMEGHLRPFFAIGLEGDIQFPKVEKIKEGSSPVAECQGCERDFLVSLLLRLKFPIPIGKLLGVYPLIGFGLGNYTSREKGVKTVHYTGVSFDASAGVEFYPLAFLTPFFECRYMLHALFDDRRAPVGKVHEKLILHSFALVIGVRFG